MADLFGAFSGMGSGVVSTLKGLLYLSPIVIILIIVITMVKSKMLYRYPVRIFRVRENGKVIEHNCKGGYIGRKNSAPFFRIKLGRWWWQYIDITNTPKPEYMDEQNRVYYKQIDVASYIQMKREKITDDEKIKIMDWLEQVDAADGKVDGELLLQLKRGFNTDSKVEYTPVESDIKYGAILSVQRIKDVLRLEPTWKKVLPYVGLVLMAIVFIVAYAMLMDKCGGCGG